MKNIFVLLIFIFSLGINGFAQCENLDSDDADNFISERTRVKGERKIQTEKKFEDGTFSINRPLAKYKFNRR